MAELIQLEFDKFENRVAIKHEGKIAVLVAADKSLGNQALAFDSATSGAIERAVASKAFEKAKNGELIAVNFPEGVSADELLIIKMGKKPKSARKAGAKLASYALKDDVLILAEGHSNAAELVFGLSLKAYNFTRHLSKSEQSSHKVTIASEDPKALEGAVAPLIAISEGVHFTRDLTNEPANILTTMEFQSRLEDLKSIGLGIEVIDEKEMAKLGMHAHLGVGFGSETPSSVVIMTWNGGSKEAPLALVGKGVVFDTGGISLKPAGGMEAMTMDMGGAGVVAGVMKSLALRKAKANVIGVVGLVENMPDGRAQRPGDVVTSMKGDTIEVINTDAEGRLVLCDALWYVQERFKPSGIIDLATLTGAAIIALGHENAAVFSNSSKFSSKFLKSAKKEGEGAWRLPLGSGYDAQLKSRIADMKNVGGRPAGSITAAQFLARFIKKDQDWIHLDIAGVASLEKDTEFAPKGATGWGVRAINRMISDYYE